MGRLFLVNLDGKIYSCKHCQAHLGLCEDIVSKNSIGELLNIDFAFYYRHFIAGMGKLIYSIRVNVTIGLKEDRMMITGMHTVSDIFCVGCGSNVGWKYEAAYEKTQKYKEGKFILERFKVSGPDGSHYWATHESHVAGSDADDA